MEYDASIQSWHICFTHVYREANIVVDTMANLAHGTDFGVLLFTNPPVSVSS